jgi:Peptidase M16 inactive domain
MLQGQALQAGQRDHARCALLPPEVTHLLAKPAHNPDERNSVVQAYLQLGEYSARARALQLLCHQARTSRAAASHTHFMRVTHAAHEPCALPPSLTSSGQTAHESPVRRSRPRCRHKRTAAGAQVIDEPLYHALRTEQQLGYSVSGSPTNTAGMLGLLVSVTSDKSPATVEAAVEAFLSGAVHTLEGLSDAQFAQHVASLATLRLEPHKNISEQAEEHWASAWREAYDFNDRYEVRMRACDSAAFAVKQRVMLDLALALLCIVSNVLDGKMTQIVAVTTSCATQVVHELQQISKKELVDYYCAHVPAGSHQRRKLAVKVCSQQHAGDGAAKDGKHGRHHKEDRLVEIIDIEQMKGALPLSAPSRGKVPPLQAA